MSVDSAKERDSVGLTKVDVGKKERNCERKETGKIKRAKNRGATFGGGSQKFPHTTEGGWKRAFIWAED